MNKQTRLMAAALLATVLLIVACATEPKSNEPVKTTTADTGTAVVPPAKEVKKRGQALVRFIHAMPGERAIDTWVDYDKPFTKVEYKIVTAYQEVPGERHTFSVHPTGDNTTKPLIENSDSLAEGKHYTIIAMPGSYRTAPALRIINDNLTPPASGKAKVRVINAAPEARNIDLYVQGKERALFDFVNPNSETSYTEVEPMNVTLEVRPTGQKSVLLTVPNVKFEAGKIYTIIVTGLVKAEPHLEAILVEDEVGS
jgi:hypothetical protein